MGTETLIEVAASLGIVVLAIFLMVPVTSFFAGFFLDRVAGLVERKDYPRGPARPRASLCASDRHRDPIRAPALALNILLRPSFFFGIGAITMVVANAYLLGRQYFEMAAMRHMPVEEARKLRKENAPQIFMVGLVPAVLALVPFVNLIVPLFSTSYFVHILKQVRASSA